MLSVLHATQDLRAPVYGMNRGTIGFLMNEYSESNLQERLSAAEEEVVNPLSMKAVDRHGKTHHELAINEVSLLRAGPQAAKLKIHIDGRLRFWRRQRAQPRITTRRMGQSSLSGLMFWL